MNKVLILDGNQRSALATVRSLGKKGIPLVVSEADQRSLAGSSRYCRQSVILPPPDCQPEAFISELANVISQDRIDILMPMTDVSTSTVLQNSRRLGKVNIPCPSFTAYDEVTNKYSLFKKAQTMRISIPFTLFIDSIEQFDTEFDTVSADLSFPVVIKPAYSRIFNENQWVSTSVSYAHTREELFKAVETQLWLRLRPFMIQEYIKGQGAGLFALYDNGQPVAFFCHRRIREKPPGGGVSVVCESVDVDSRMREIAEKILGDVKWHGVAMVEFKVSPDGTPYLIEINGRFWGSLQLSVDAGIDFPYLAYLLAAGDSLPLQDSYRLSVRNRWLLGDLDRLYLVLKDRSGAYNTTKKFAETMAFLNFFRRNSYYEVNRMDDMRPFLFELRKYVKDLVR